MEKMVIQRFTDRVRSVAGELVKSIILFGSRARGDGQESSDYDFLIVLSETTERTIDSIRSIEVEMLDEYDALVGSIMVTEEGWLRRSTLPLGLNIRREGVAV